jgi:hypothetical protein
MDKVQMPSNSECYTPLPEQLEFPENCCQEKEAWKWQSTDVSDTKCRSQRANIWRTTSKTSFALEGVNAW